jgi:hypothetical protein
MESKRPQPAEPRGGDGASPGADPGGTADGSPRVELGGAALGFRDPRRSVVTRTAPASWEEGLVTGNGTLGAVLHGDARRDVVTLGHAGLFMPVDAPRPPVDTASHLGTLRALLAAERFQEAADLVVTLGKEEGYPGWLWTDPLIPAFDLELLPERAAAPPGGVPEPAGPDAGVGGVLRGADFSTGVVAILAAGGAGAREAPGGAGRPRGLLRRVFVSRPANLVVISLTAAGAGAGGPSSGSGGSVDCAITIQGRPPDPDNLADAERAIAGGVASVERAASARALTFRSVFRRQWPGALHGYIGAVGLRAPGGTIEVEGPAADGRVRIRGAREVLLLARVELAPTEAALAGLPGLVDALDAAFDLPGASFEALLAEHAAVHGAMLGRVTLDLGAGVEQHLRTSEDLLAEAALGPAPLALVEKQFVAARCLAYSSSGALFPTLQGIWTGSWTPPWSSDFTHNGNVPTALAAMLSTGMAECLQPYFRYLGARMADFRENARRHYGCRGIFVPARTSSHGLDVHFHGRWCMTFWTAGAGWAARTFFDHFLYTGDETFLREVAVPFMEEAAAFYEDFLFPGPDGRLVFSPSYSPENSPPGSDAQACVNATMDMAVTRELFTNLIAAHEVLGLPPGAGPERWRALLAALPDYQINEDGAVKEWLHPHLHDNHDHRHVSHLYALFDGLPAELEERPDLLDAFVHTARRRMEIRRRDGGGVMAFGLAQLGLVAAALRQPELCAEIVDWLSARYWRPSLVTTHDPGRIFNVDLGGGYPAVIARILLDSRPGHLQLLPGLPARWASGTVTGLPARGGVRVERMTWTDDGVWVALSAARAQRVSVGFPRRAGPGRVELELGPGVVTELELSRGSGAPP